MYRVQDKLLEAFYFFTEMTMKFYPTLEIGIENPDVIEDYFNAAMKYIRGFGKDFLKIVNVGIIIDYALQMLSIQESYCYISICYFIESFLNLPYSLKTNNKEESLQIKVFIIELLNSRKAVICSILSNSFINQPSRNLLSDDGSLSSILTVLIPHYYQVIENEFETYFIKPIKDVLGDNKGIRLVELLKDKKRVYDLSYVKSVIHQYVRDYRNHIH